ncbi:helix-turn-helix domain-containing protein [Actinoplanes sp. NPDC026619]|uniref:helix-turn-helix domain-containing protein n=1 Tax=Actinoplanes sp. NPDC026619 TaxID=3155798 RepID=UPI0033FA4751
MPNRDAKHAPPVDTDEEELYFSVEQVARQLKVSARWLADQCREGRVEHVHIARKRKFTRAQVQKLLDTHTVQPAKVADQERGYERAVRRVQRDRAQRRR